MSAQQQEIQELDRISILFQLGFRPFFLGAGMIAVLFMILWTASYSFGWAHNFPRMSSIHWHAHEMLYGYAMAVIAGFLLTAVCNWTGQPALQGNGLMLPFLFWLAARLASMLDLAVSPWLMLICDLGFWILLSVAVMKPILKVRQWRQSGILAKLLLLGFSNLAFYAGIMGWFADGIRWGLYGGLYLIIGLVLTMGRRVIPFFTERGVGYSVELKNSNWLDLCGIVIFLFFFAWELFFPGSVYSAHFALALFTIHAIRVSGWLTPGIWKKPLLWSLFAAYFFMISGFLLHAGNRYFGWNPFLAVHAFAMGGIGLISLSMMARVSLGHSGRSIHEPPSNLTYALALLISGVIFRVFFPLLWSEEYLTWIALAQVFWILAFGIFLLLYYPILTRPRIDGLRG